MFFFFVAGKRILCTITCLRNLRIYVAELHNLVNDVNTHARGILLALIP